MQEKEIWKDIPGYEGLYQVNQWGDIFSFYTNKKIKYSLSKDGYKQYNLSKNKKKQIMTAHRAVALAFIPNPNNYPVVNHKDENPLNCYVDNLEWCTYQYNAIYNNAHMKRGKNLSKKVYQYDLNGELVAIYNSVKEVSEFISSYCGNISTCANGKDYKGKHCVTVKGYIFSYEELSEEDIKNRLDIQNKQAFRWKKKIVQKLNLNNEIISEYESVQIASKENNIYTSQISRACRGYEKGYICHGYKWRYKE